MMYTQEEKHKIYDNLDKIKAYLETLQSNIRDRITIDFGEMCTYANFDRERKFHLYVDKDEINGRSGGLYMEYTKERISSSTRASIYNHLDYAVELIQNWQSIKREINTKITQQNEALAAINNFEV